MADVKISALPASTTPLAGTEVLPIVQGTTTKQVAVSDLTAGRAVATLNLSTSGSTSTTPVLSFNGANAPLAMGASVSGNYLQALMQNKSATAGASTNYVLSNDSGTDNTYYGEFGMNSSVFSASTPADYFSINNGIYYSGHDGDVSLGSGNGYKTYLAWGTIGQSAHVINATGALGLSTNLGTTPALSGTTGYGTAKNVLVSQGSAAAPIWSTSTDILVNGVTLGIGAGAVATNTVVGNGAMAGTATGANNVCVGSTAGTSLTSGASNTAIGSTALRTATAGTQNVAVGYRALYSFTGNNAVGIGHQAGQSRSTNSDGYGTVFVGYNCGLAVTTGNDNTFIGAGSGLTNITGSLNTALGAASLYNNVGSNSTSIGYQTLFYNTTAGNLTALGNQALYNNTTNVATLGAISSGGTGYAGGGSAGPFTVTLSTTSGATFLTYPTAAITVASGVITVCTLVSAGVGASVTSATVLTATSAAMVAAGFTAGGSGLAVAPTFASGTNNTALSYQAGYGNASANANTTGTNNTYIGYQTVGSAVGNTNELVIGYTAVGIGSNTTVLGNSSTTATKVFGSLTSTGVIYPQQAATASAPAYVKGGIYFDTTLNKLRVGGASAWETITSV